MMRRMMDAILNKDAMDDKVKLQLPNLNVLLSVSWFADYN